MFDDAFLAKVKADPVDAVIEAIERVQAGFGPSEWEESDHAALIELLALLQEIIDAGLIVAPPPPGVLSGFVNRDCKTISDYASELHKRLTAARHRDSIDIFKQRFRASLQDRFAYEFSQGDLDRIQTLINELRVHIAAADYFEADHQQRLLKRLERLQAEIHKKVSDLDRLWGLVGDAGVAIGKFGEDAKPIVDRIREITQIVWRTQSHAEELPSGMDLPSLEAPAGQVDET